MSIVISLLRGINVGGNHKIRMEALRAIYESAGAGAPETYIQSGNVVLSTRERNLDKLARGIEDEIERTAGFRPPVVMRTLDQMREVVARNPFAGRQPDLDPAKLLVTFLAAEPTAEARRAASLIEVKPEEMHIAGRETFIYFPNGLGKSKLPFARIERALGTIGTSRNWNTVLKLIELAQARR